MIIIQPMNADVLQRAIAPAIEQGLKSSPVVVLTGDGRRRGARPITSWWWWSGGVGAEGEGCRALKPGQWRGLGTLEAVEAWGEGRILAGAPVCSLRGCS